MSESPDIYPPFEVDGNMGYDMGEVSEWWRAAIEYINLLQNELNNCAGFLYTHGWSTPEEVVQQGKDLRAFLGIKGSGE